MAKHEHEHHHDKPAERVHVEAQGAILVCEKTTTGSWICCSEDAAKSCARGFTPRAAAALWEKAQALDD